MARGAAQSKALKRVVFGGIFNQTFSFDAGSSNVVLATRSSQTILREPCLIALAPRKSPPRRRARASAPQFRLQAVGAEAAVALAAEENGVRLVHPIDHGRIADPDALELVLRKVMDQARLSALRKAVFGVRMTLLTALHLGEQDRMRYEDLLRDFGFNRIHSLEAPVAAARGAGLDTGASRGQMLIDIGGGQTTVVAFTLGSIAAWHWCPVGGRALDEAIEAYVARRYRVRLHPAAAEAIKLALGSVYPRPRPETLEIAGFDPATGVEKKVTLDDNELRDVLIDGCEPLVLAVHQSFDGVPPELAADISQGEITLVGGGALLAGLPQFLAERTGLRFRVAQDPINAAIRGAFALA
jgi:rod shape-determining protein MreB and related proteins